MEDYDRRIRAVHEAGHFVVGVECGFAVGSVTILDEGKSGGNTVFDFDEGLAEVTYAHPRRLRRQVERYMTMVVAGGLSSSTVVLNDATGALWLAMTCVTDRERMRQFARQAFEQPTQESCLKYIERAKRRAWTILRQPSIMCAVERLSDVLYDGSGVLDGDQAQRVLNDALGSDTPPRNKLTRERFDLFDVGKWCAEDDEGKTCYSVMDAYDEFRRADRKPPLNGVLSGSGRTDTLPNIA